jgi:hypothetical protein
VRSNVGPVSEGGDDKSDANMADNESDTVWDGIEEDLKNERTLYEASFPPLVLSVTSDGR